MKKIYFDQASTTFPKPQAVPDAMYRYMTQIGSNINRGSYEKAYQTEEAVYETRQKRDGKSECYSERFSKAGGSRHHVLDGAQRRHAPLDPAGQTGGRVYAGSLPP